MKRKKQATFEEWKEQYLKENFQALKAMDPSITEEEVLADFIPVYEMSQGDDESKRFIGVATIFDCFD